jgi:hypothetical protein
MRKGKVGLQKSVSRIFTGIQVPKKGTNDSAKSPSSGQHLQTEQKPLVSQTPLVQPTPVVIPKPLIPQKPASGDQSRITSVEPNRAVSQPQRVFTIPEPAGPAANTSKHVVYEPQAHHNAAEAGSAAANSPVYTPPAPAQSTYMSSSAGPVAQTVKQPRIESVSPKPDWQSALLKIIQPITAKLLAPKRGVSPAKQKATIVMIALLPLIFVYVFTKTFIIPDKAAAKNAKNTTAVAAVASNGQIEWQLPPVFPENLRDPMVIGAATSQSEQAGPVVKGIVYSEDNPCAVVGDRIVSAGDIVDGATVVKISPDSVEFAAGDKKWSQKVER